MFGLYNLAYIKEEVDVYADEKLGTVNVKNVYSLAAFFLSFLWAFYNKLWGIGFFLLALNTLLGLIALIGGVFSGISALLGVAVQLWVGLRANEWKREALMLKGYSYQKTLEQKPIQGLSPITETERNSKILLRQLISHNKYGVNFNGVHSFTNQEIQGALQLVESSAQRKKIIGYALVVIGITIMASYSGWYYLELYPSISAGDILLNIFILIFPFIFIVYPGMKILSSAEHTYLVKEVLETHANK